MRILNPKPPPLTLLVVRNSRGHTRGGMTMVAMVVVVVVGSRDASD